MSLVVFERVSLAYGAQRILSSASFRVEAGEKIGLIGPNGAGKSTLLKLLTGSLKPDDGVVRRSKHCHLGYLPQDIPEYEEQTVLQAVLATVPGRLDIEERIETDTCALESSSDPEKQMALAQSIAELTERLTHLDTFYSEHQAIRILAGLGFNPSEASRPARELSGGWRMRVALAGLLFQQPDLLLLDEPTNHLDMRSVLWLDEFLGELRSAVVLICHDRHFLNRHVRRVISLEPEGVRSYRGNYDAYLSQRAEEEEIRTSERKNQERKLEEMERFVERFKAKATKARQAQSRARRVKRLKDELDEAMPIAARRTLNFRFPATDRTGRRVIELRDVGKAFGDNVVYDGASSIVERGDRIAILGRNGAGKTTLLRLLAGELPLDKGQVKLGSNVVMGYYAQHHSDVLNRQQTVLEEVWRMAPSLGQSAVRGICGAFLFSRHEVDKTIGVLSGGERARVLLARLLVNPGNLLLMDEPTNHLDISASEALAAALRAYDGTLIFVSHNSAFVESIATRIWDVRDGLIHDHPGDFESWRHHLSLATNAADSVSGVRTPTPDSDNQAIIVPVTTTVSSRVTKEREKRRKSAQSTSDTKKTVRRRRRNHNGAEPVALGSGAASSAKKRGSHELSNKKQPSNSHNSKGGRTSKRRRAPSYIRLAARIQDLEECVRDAEETLSAIEPSDRRFPGLFAAYQSAQRELERLRDRLH
ncbi:MAG: ABC-F family ATP-binding cassette domain-containing protein [Myxococcota bacterium]|nr:ABC-F family ATP-binding cassette domain-containing protein [Myxococcota bacterium]